MERLKFIGYLHDFGNIKKHAIYEQSKVKRTVINGKKKIKEDDEFFEQKLMGGGVMQTSAGELDIFNEPTLDLDEVEKILDVKPDEPYKEKTF